ncbi:hypothetical protein SODALDRAFT_359074 [Sodiomyces alkalinus F11]|uniref:Uncharacterized protein n=1 Tax=Sodiomyces alkalinus (strain CBS 110278 / VKM F-3762 / F11) TaxID=1314773 RepID=A0A3N2PXK8_SODAK|nr:hypothetical protein SODALDRAFT_359074 [Sodiomyces alkalinus F11]ROT39204.1 hypothetical protein SODALDRAFT_359074 [Sodiomyces alkalinus F11]
MVVASLRPTKPPKLQCAESPLEIHCDIDLRWSLLSSSTSTKLISLLSLEHPMSVEAFKAPAARRVSLKLDLSTVDSRPSTLDPRPSTPANSLLLPPYWPLTAVNYCQNHASHLVHPSFFHPLHLDRSSLLSCRSPDFLSRNVDLSTMVFHPPLLLQAALGVSSLGDWPIYTSFIGVHREEVSHRERSSIIVSLYCSSV